LKGGKKEGNEIGSFPVFPNPSYVRIRRKRRREVGRRGFGERGEGPAFFRFLVLLGGGKERKGKKKKKKGREKKPALLL